MSVELLESHVKNNINVHCQLIFPSFLTENFLAIIRIYKLTPLYAIKMDDTS
jgi:hypothetical protein